jgi:FkbM family methyltransferase
VGWFSIQLLNKAKHNAIYAVEPVSITYEKMKANLRLNNVLDKVQTFNLGFYDEDGESKIYVPAALEASSLRPVNDDFYLKNGVADSEKATKEQREMTCQLMTLDTFVGTQSINNVDFIKCDTEGAEKMVFDGGKDVSQECSL